MRRGLGLALWLLISSFVVSLQAQDKRSDQWREPYFGVRHLNRRGPSLDVHVVLVDLALTDLSIVATRPSDRGMSVREFARRYGADIAINANYFHWDRRSCGLAVGDGTVWSDSYQGGCTVSFGFGAGNQALAFDSSALVRGPLPWTWMRQVITGLPWLVRHGHVDHARRPMHYLRERHPRTAVGLSRDRQTLIIVVADGRRKGIPGLSGRELTELMLEFGAYDAINLDGGGSSELYVAAQGGVQNRPSDGRARHVSNHLGIRIGGRGKVWRDRIAQVLP